MRQETIRLCLPYTLHTIKNPGFPKRQISRSAYTVITLPSPEPGPAIQPKPRPIQPALPIEPVFWGSATPFFSAR
jgi:hypothetical protein